MNSVSFNNAVAIGRFLGVLPDVADFIIGLYGVRSQCAPDLLNAVLSTQRLTGKRVLRIKTTCNPQTLEPEYSFVLED